MPRCTCTICGFSRRYRALKHQMTPAVRRLYDDYYEYAAHTITDLEMDLIRKRDKTLPKPPFKNGACGTVSPD